MKGLWLKSGERIRFCYSGVRMCEDFDYGRLGEIEEAVVTLLRFRTRDDDAAHFFLLRPKILKNYVFGNSFLVSSFCFIYIFLLTDLLFFITSIFINYEKMIHDPHGVCLIKRMEHRNDI